MIKYSVLTYIFNNGDILREAPKEECIEYICVTDNPKLQSDTWKIVVDAELKDVSPEYASFYVRYHPFKYCTSNICLRVDGSIQIMKSLLSLFEEFDISGKDVCVMTNSRATFIHLELSHWEFLPKEMLRRQLDLYRDLNVDIYKCGCIQSPISLTRNNKLCNDCDALTWGMIESLSSPTQIARPTQVIMTVALYLTKGLKIMFVDEYLIQSDTMQWCRHNKSIVRRSGIKLEHKEFFGTPIKIYKFKNVHSIINEFWEKTKDRVSLSNILYFIKQHASRQNMSDSR
jgi:hypothetical protein